MKKLSLLLITLLCANQAHGMYQARAALILVSVAAVAMAAPSLTLNDDPNLNRFQVKKCG